MSFHGQTGLTPGSQDLKDFARQSGLDVVYSEVTRERDANGNAKGYVMIVPLVRADLLSLFQLRGVRDCRGPPERG